MPVIRTITAYENETVEVHWSCRDGHTHIERYSIPPKPVRQARWQEEQPTQGAVVTTPTVQE